MKNFSCLLLLVFCQFTQAENSQSEFFEQLSKLCGKTFVGKTVYPDDPQHAFAGKKLVMNVKSCTDEEIRIPFQVGEDKSRTWILTKTPKGLLFKHDHRYPDGKSHKLTMYGGYANDQGTAHQQFFPADEETHQLVPEGKTNVWSIIIDPVANRFIYDLQRHNKPRYQAQFDIR